MAEDRYESEFTGEQVDDAIRKAALLNDQTLIITDNTDNNASTSKHGFMPKLPGSGSLVLTGDGTYQPMPNLDGTLSLDQTTPQTIINGTPLLNREISEITDPKHLLTKEYLDSRTRGGGGFLANLYFRTDNSDVSGYKRIDYQAEIAETELVGTVNASEGTKLFRQYLYDDVLNSIVLDAGIYSVDFRVKLSSASGVTQLRFEAFVRHTDTTETVLFAVDSEEINNTEYASFRREYSAPLYTVVATDRFGVRIYAKTTRVTDVTITTIVGGSNAAYFSTPIALRHELLRGRDLPNQHPASAIEGLGTAALLDAGTSEGDVLVLGASGSIKASGTISAAGGTLTGNLLFENTGTTRSIYNNTTDGNDNGALLLAGAPTSTSRGAYINLAGNEYATDSGSVKLFAGNVTGAGINFYTGASTGRMRIGADGKVRIGSITDATEALDVTGNIKASGNISAEGNLQISNFRIRNSSNFTSTVIENDYVGQGDIFIRAYISDARLGNIYLNDLGGTVKIGTGTASEALDVTGNIKASGTVSGSIFNATAYQVLGNNISSIYQATLVSGTNIKTINGESLLGSGNIDIKDDTDLADAIATKHTRNTDTILDEGGANEVAASVVKPITDRFDATPDLQLSANEIEQARAGMAEATTEAKGLMSAEDKTAFDGISVHHDAEDSYKVKATGLQAQTKTVVSVTDPTPDYIGQPGRDSAGRTYKAIALSGTMWEEDVVNSNRFGVLFNQSAYPTFDATAKTLTIPSGTRLIYGGLVKVINGDGGTSATAKTVDISSQSYGYVIFNPSTDTWTVKAYTDLTFALTDIIIASYSNYGARYNLLGRICTDNIANEAVTSVKSTYAGKFGLLYNASSYPVFNPTAKTLTIPGASRIFVGIKGYPVKGDGESYSAATTIDLSSTATGYVTYNYKTEVWTVRAHTVVTFTEDEILMASYGGYGATSYMVGVTPDGSITSAKTTVQGRFAVLFNATSYPNFSSTGKLLTIPGASRIYAGTKGYLVKGDNGTYWGTKTIDISAYASGTITFKPSTEDFVVRAHTTVVLAEDEILVATYGNYGAVGYLGCPFTINGKDPFVVDNKIYPVLSPEYVEHDLSGISGIFWSDFVVINDELVIFQNSSEEDHAEMDGKIYRVNMSTWTQEGSTILHNLGHCNTVHYDSNTDVLMIGNLPGSTAYPCAIYLIYDFSTLLGSNIDYATIDKTIIDLSSADVSAQSTVACFGENNSDKRNVVYVSGAFNAYWQKILLGMGTNDLGKGTYSAANADKYNGSYKTIWTKTYSLLEDTAEEVIQGIDYQKGKIYSAQGHTGIKGSIWQFNNDNSPHREIISCKEYNDSGDEADIFTEGMIIHNGKIYQGVVSDAGVRKIIEYDLL